MPEKRKLTPEEARQKYREYRRAYDQSHPDKAMQYRLTAYGNYLRKHGRKLLIPIPPPPPWNTLQKECLIHAIETAMREQLPEEVRSDG